MPAWMKRKMLSMSSNTSRCSSSRKYSAIVSAARAHAEPRPGRLVHLSVDHDHVREHPGRFHVVVKLLAFARALADAAKHAHTLLVPDHVVDHLGEQDRLAHARAAEQPALPPRSSGRSTSMTLMPVSKISDFVERSDNGGGARCTERHRTSDGGGSPSMTLPNTSNIRERNPFADRRFQRSARVEYGHAAGEALGGRQRDAAHMLRIALREHFDDDLPFFSRMQHGVDRRQMLHRNAHRRRCRAPRRRRRDSSGILLCRSRFPPGGWYRPLSVGALAGRCAGQVEPRHADPAVGHPVVHVEAVRLAEIVAPVDAGREHDVGNGAAAVRPATPASGPVAANGRGSHAGLAPRAPSRRPSNTVRVRPHRALSGFAHAVVKDQPAVAGQHRRGAAADFEHASQGATGLASR